MRPDMRILPSRPGGFTLIELMVAITIGLLLLVGLTSLFASNNHAQTEIEKGNRQVENGRYAMQLLGNDLRNAGYYAEFDPTVLTLPAALPNPCATDLPTIKSALPLHVQGYSDISPLGCLSDVRDGTDVLVMRHTSTCALGEAGCDPASAGGPFFQASLCNNLDELGSGNTDRYFGLATDPGALSLHRRDCTAMPGTGTLAAVRRLHTHIYFIANNNEAGDKVPTLKRAEVVSIGGAFSVNIVPLAEGIENLQAEYGIDTNADGVPDTYSAAPDSASGCAAPDCAVTNWNRVVSIKLYVLARTTVPSAGYTDTKTYELGSNADGSPHTISAANDHLKRHVFSALVALPNPAGRKNP
jgi:type IV pilus assembly protein PilW